MRKTITLRPRGSSTVTNGVLHLLGMWIGGLLLAAISACGQGLADKRAFGVLPNYKTVEPGADAGPLTAKEKLILATKDTFDPPILFVSGGLAGISQAKNQDPSFGQGTGGYMKRFGAGLTDQVVGNYMVESAFPTLFHKTPVTSAREPAPFPRAPLTPSRGSW